MRDASQLTGSVTKDLGGTDAEARLNSPLYDTTDLQTFSQEIRFASTEEGPFQWVAGAFYQQYDREYGQNLPTPGYDALTQDLLGVDSSDFNAPPDTPFFSDLTYDFEQFAVFGEATYRFNPQVGADRGSALLRLQRRSPAHFRGTVRRRGLHRPAGIDRVRWVLAARDPVVQPQQERVVHCARLASGFRLGGINDPLNVGLCSAADLVTYSGYPGTGRTKKSTNYELGAKTRLADGRVTFNASVFMTQIEGSAGHRRRRHLLVAHHHQCRRRDAWRGVRVVRAA